jgi:DNA-binding NtrC family response regulator/pSer/pThr/pTyr-binding forkhead associated (FHA) protein
MAYRLIAKFEDQTIRATLQRGRNVIGSDPGCEVCLPNPTVSRRHAVVTVNDGTIELEDLGSTNGTLLRSRRVERAELDIGDIFVIGRVVVLLEQVSDDDLEVGIVVPRDLFDPSGVISVDDLDLTESFSPLDRFALDHLPRLLERLCGDADRQRMSQLVGYALFETMPVTAVEILEQGDGDESGVLYSAERPEDEDSVAEWVESAAGGCQVRARFFRRGAGDHFRPVVESALLILVLAERSTAPPRPVFSAQPPPARPQPPTVEPEVQRIYDQAERVAKGDVGVLIYGESGTGKEVLARFLHAASPRAEEPLVTINCASLPRDLLEAELFGVEKGVATGVEARPGKFEAADQGTLFLDEIGDMAMETQAKILRVIQEKEVFRIGGHTPHPARSRVVAATNRPIHKMLADGSFRSDLYHRIATWEVELPPLRNRRADIPNLAAYFLAREAQRYGVRVRGISRLALRALRRYRWPGNIRQLKNEISRAVLFLENRELLDTTRLSPEIVGDQPAMGGVPLSTILESVEREEITAALEACGGDTSLAAERLQISRPTLYRRIKSLGIEIPTSEKGA